MTKLLAGLFLFVALAGNAIADSPEEFVVTGYRLAFVHVDESGAITNEYVPRGQTLENWSTLIGVRVWPQAKEVAEIAGPYVRSLEPLMVRDSRALEPAGSEPGTDVVFELYLAPADKAYLEYNLIRFVREPGTPGVKSYQFAARSEYKLDAAVTEYDQRRAAWLAAISGLQLTAETEELDESTADAADDDEDSASDEDDEAVDDDADDDSTVDVDEEGDDDDADADEADEADAEDDADDDAE